MWLSNTKRPEAMSHFLGRIESISFLVPPPTFQQIPLAPLSDVALQLVLRRRGSKNEKRQEKKKNLSVIATKLLLQIVLSSQWQSWKVCTSVLWTWFQLTFLFALSPFLLYHSPCYEPLELTFSNVLTYSLVWLQVQLLNWFLVPF